MVKRLLLLTFIWTTSLLFSDEPDYDQIVFGGELSAVIDGCINAITGDYFDV